VSYFVKNKVESLQTSQSGNRTLIAALLTEHETVGLFVQCNAEWVLDDAGNYERTMMVLRQFPNETLQGYSKRDS
jgi:hypothetical protein